MEIVTFIFLKPFSENPFFTILIYGLFIGSLIYNWKINSQYNRTLQSDEVNQEDLDSFKHFSAIPGILMSIGIVGTFFLIYSSLSQFNIDDIQGISRIITNNVAPAFSVSALGVTASILYITFEGLIISRFKSHLKNKKQTSSDDNYLKLFQEQNNALKTIINGIQEQAEAFKDMKSFATSLQNASAGMEKLGEVSKNLEQILNPEKLGQVIADAVNGEMKPILENINQVITNVSEVSENVDRNSQQITDFLQNELKNEIMIPLKESVDKTTQSMEEIKEALDKTSQAMVETNKGFDKLNESLGKLEEAQKTFVNNLNNVLDKQRKEFEATTKTISSTYNTLTETVNNQITNFEKNSEIILNSFTSLSGEMKTFLKDYKEDYKQVLADQDQRIKAIAEESSQIIKEAGSEVIKLTENLDNILDSQRNNFEETIKQMQAGIANQISDFENNSKTITNSFTSLSNEMKTFLEGYKADYKKILEDQDQRIKAIAKESSELIKAAGNEVAKVATEASTQLKNTLSGVDEALVSTSKSIKEELDKFKDSYTETLKGFLDSQETILKDVFEEQTNNLNNVVTNFKTTLEDDVNTRKTLNAELDKLIKKTNTFVSATQDILAGGFDEQAKLLDKIFKNNKELQDKLKDLIYNSTGIYEETKTAVESLIQTVSTLQQDFNKNQQEILEKYQIQVDEHLKEILQYMIAVYQTSEMNNKES